MSAPIMELTPISTDRTEDHSSGVRNESNRNRSAPARSVLMKNGMKLDTIGEKKKLINRIAIISARSAFCALI